MVVLMEHVLTTFNYRDLYPIEKITDVLVPRYYVHPEAIRRNVGEDFFE